MVSMYDRIRKDAKFQCKRLAKALFGLCACIMASQTMAQEGEQFSLTGQPTVLFDGGSGALTGEYNGISYLIIDGYAVAQGDMVLGRVLPDGSLALTAQTRGLGQSSAFERWPDGIIPYQFNDSVSQVQRDRAQEAIAHWNTNTRIKLVRRTDENAENYADYISFELSAGCASYVGKKGGAQNVWLADNCTVGSIIHEIGHAIGLFHEHTRPDRDNFVQVHLENVSGDKEVNFEVIDVGAATYSEYDYGSIMHYGEYFFSNNGERSISVPDGVLVGQRDALSAKDISSINTMYATDLKLDVSTRGNEANTQIDLLVTNLGDLGAAELELVANWGDDADWLSISTGSGWDCKQFGPDLRCTRASLRGVSSNNFIVLVDAGSSSTENLKIRVESRTLDTDLNNNTFNDVIVQVDPVAPPPPMSNQDDTTEPPTTDSTGSSTDNVNSGTPVAAAANSAEESDGGGGAALYFLVLLFGWVLKRAR